MIFYYNVFDLEKNFLGVITSLDFRYYSEESKRILCCEEKESQYIILNDVFYRVEMLNNESKNIKFPFEKALIEKATKEEYEEYIQKQEKEKLEQK